jgi:hypothetical protein
VHKYMGTYVTSRHPRTVLIRRQKDVLDLEGESDRRPKPAGKQAEPNKCTPQAEIRSSGFNPAGLERQIANLRSDVRFLEGSDDDLFQLIEELAGIGSFGGGTGSPDASIDPSSIEKPIGCSDGDVAVWDILNGLDC